MSDKNKLNGAGPDTGAAPDTSAGTAADVDEIMKKYDRESNTRVFEGVPRVVIKYLLAAFSLLMVYMNLFANWDERVRRASFVGMVNIFAFLMYPAKKGSGSVRTNYVPCYD